MAGEKNERLIAENIFMTENYDNGLCNIKTIIPPFGHLKVKGSWWKTVLSKHWIVLPNKSKGKQSIKMMSKPIFHKYTLDKINTLWNAGCLKTDWVKQQLKKVKNVECHRALRTAACSVCCCSKEMCSGCVCVCRENSCVFMKQASVHHQLYAIWMYSTNMDKSTELSPHYTTGGSGCCGR